MGVKARGLKQPSLIISKFVDFLMLLINQASDAALITPKKYQHSGLQKDLKSHKAPETFDPRANGGLDDEDTFSVHPTFAYTKVPHLNVHSQPLPAAEDLK